MPSPIGAHRGVALDTGPGCVFVHRGVAGQHRPGRRSRRGLATQPRLRSATSRLYAFRLSPHLRTLLFDNNFLIIICGWIGRAGLNSERGRQKATRHQQQHYGPSSCSASPANQEWEEGPVLRLWMTVTRITTAKVFLRYLTFTLLAGLLCVFGIRRCGNRNHNPTIPPTLTHTPTTTAATTAMLLLQEVRCRDSQMCDGLRPGRWMDQGQGPWGWGPGPGLVSVLGWPELPGKGGHIWD